MRRKLKEEFSGVPAAPSPKKDGKDNPAPTNEEVAQAVQEKIAVCLSTLSIWQRHHPQLHLSGLAFLIYCKEVLSLFRTHK